MKQIEVPYEDMKQEMVKEIQKRKYMVLATSKGESVTARTMLCVSIDLTIYCLARPATRKHPQIVANPNVALASGNLQIEGVASLKGRPLDEGNVAYIEAYRELDPDMFEHHNRGNFGTLDLVEIIPKRIALYKNAYLDNVPESYWDILNVDRKEAHRVKTSHAGEALAYTQ